MISSERLFHRSQFVGIGQPFGLQLLLGLTQLDHFLLQLVEHHVARGNHMLIELAAIGFARLFDRLAKRRARLYEASNRLVLLGRVPVPSPTKRGTGSLFPIACRVMTLASIRANRSTSASLSCS